MISQDHLTGTSTTWHQGGNLTRRVNLTQRINVVDSNETENFTYDFLDRLLSVSGAYSESYAYNAIGNLTGKGGQNYTYDVTQPHTMAHAVRTIGSTTYQYDANGNMTQRVQGGITRNMGWDVENRLTSVTEAGNTTSFFYDGDGKRVKKVEGGVTTVYVNKYFEKTGTEITLYYYLGGTLVALKKASTLRYVVKDHLTGTSTTWDTSGNVVANIKYMPYGDRRNSTGAIDTDRQFTGQRLDGTGLYYYGARYYDPGIGRFISPDNGVQISPGVLLMSRALTATAGTAYQVSPEAPKDPQALNRYTYVFDNPLKYTDADGRQALLAGAAIGAAAYTGTVIAVNLIKYGKKEGYLSAFFKHGLEGGNAKDFLKATLAGAVTSGLSSVFSVGAVLSRNAPIIAGAVGTEAQYLSDVVSGDKSLTPEGIIGNLVLGGVGGVVDVYIPNAGPIRSATVGLLEGLGTGVAGELFLSHQGAGIIGGITLGEGSSVSGRDAAGNSVVLVSIEGNTIWATEANVKSMQDQGEAVTFVH